VSLAPPDSIGASTPHCPTNVKVLEAMAKFHSESTEQPNVPPRPAPGTDNPVSSLTHSSPTSREGIQIQQLQRDDREEAGCGSVYFVDSPLPSAIPDDAYKTVSEKSTNSVNILNGGVGQVDSCTYIGLTASLAARTTVSLVGGERQQLTTDAVGGWQRLRGLGRGRGRIIPLSELSSDVSDPADGSQLIGRTPLAVGRARIGRGRARSIMRLPYVCPEQDSSNECPVVSLERGNLTENNESGSSAILSQQCVGLGVGWEQSVEAAEEGTLGVQKLQETPKNLSRSQNFASDVGKALGISN